MKVEKDFEELLELLNKNRVRFCIVGAYAVAFYGKPRFTKDFDILVDATGENGKRVIETLEEFGFKGLNLSPEDFSRKGNIIQLGYSPIRIDILTSIQGCSFSQIWKGKKGGYYGKQKVYFIGLKELIKNKAEANRRQDQVDLEFLLKKQK